MSRARISTKFFFCTLLLLTTATTETTSTTTTTTTDELTTATTTPATPITQQELPEGFCIGKPQWNSHPMDCSKYVRCINGKPLIGTCAVGLRWDESITSCNHEALVKCDIGEGSTHAPPTTESVTTDESTSTTEATESTSTTATTDEPETSTTVSETSTTEPASTTEPTSTTTQEPTDTKTQEPTTDGCSCLYNQKNCRCIGTQTPGDFNKADTPKMVLVSFDDSVNDLNYALYKELFDGRTNPNSCPASTTYFVSGIGTNYDRVRDLNKKGHEIAVHTLTHQTPTMFWASASEEELTQEIVGMKHKLRDEGISPVLGYRNPFLQTAGDRTFRILKDNGFLYDSTLPAHFGRLWWPYTFNDGGSPACVIQPCPQESFPGLWEIPMLQMQDTGATCSMFDACHRFKSQTADGVFDFFKTNFERHFSASSAPFPMFAHAGWMMHHAYLYRKEGLIRFLEYLANRDDVYMVNFIQTIAWINSPTKLGDIKAKTGPFSC